MFWINLKLQKFMYSLFLILNVSFKNRSEWCKRNECGKETGPHKLSENIVIAESVASMQSNLFCTAGSFCRIWDCNVEVQNFILDSSQSSESFKKCNYPTICWRHNLFSQSFVGCWFQAFEYRFSFYCMTHFCSAFLLNTKWCVLSPVISSKSKRCKSLSRNIAANGFVS